MNRSLPLYPLNPLPIPAEDDFDCLKCGACCRDIADGTALVSDEDIARWTAEGATAILDSLVEGHFSQMGFGTHPDGTCLHLGTPDHPNACSIYATRGWACHALEPASPQCRTYRKTVFARRLAPSRD